MVSLPIDPLLPEIVGALREARALVIEAPPGAGKTTRVPRALFQSDVAGGGEVVVLQPRRLPARLAAERVAEELGERVGGRVGYTVRFAEAAGPQTRLRFVTEGILIRRLLADPGLRGVSVVVLDEFHERHLATDLALPLLRDLQRRRPDLRLCVMSATLEADPVRAFLDDCAAVRSEGRLFEVALDHLPYPDDRPLVDQVTGAVRRLVQEGLEGDLLVFLPGAGEIRRCAEALSDLARARDLLILPLHGDLSPAEQDRAVRSAPRRKVILSTNVAETSVTIDGVVAVIDSGLARIATHDPWSGLPTLTLGKISQASAIQRAGRAGRTRPGRAVRLYTRHDFESRRPYDLPEVQRLDLAEPLLTLHALGVRDATVFPWFEHPAGAALAAGEELLRRLGAVDGTGALTEIGRGMLRFPLHPRLGRLVLEGVRRGVGEEAATLAALIGEGDIADDARTRFGPRGGTTTDGGGDVLERLDRFQQARQAGFARDRLRGLGLDPRAAEAVERARRQLVGALGREERGPPTARSASAIDEALAIAILAAFPDRVMQRRTPGAGEAVLATGGAAEVGPLPPEALMVAVDVEERAPGTGRRGSARVRLAVGVQPEWLLDVAAGFLTEGEELAWNPQTERVERRTRLAYGQVILEETRRPAEPSPEAARLLAEAALAAGLGGGDGLGALAGKVEALRQGFPDLELPPLDPADLRSAIVAASEGRTSLAELRETPLEELWLARLPPNVAQLLRTETPDRVRLPGGRETPVHYEPDKPPWIESRLQDFFGMASGPAICRGRVPLVLHLLAPNHRAVQVTRDLTSFWRQHYPALRRELGRKYPRHAWPEDGATATPPPPKVGGPRRMP